MLSCLIFSFLKGPKHVAAAESFFFSPGTSRTERTECKVPGSNLFSQHTPEADKKIALNLPYNSNLKVVRSISTSYQDGS